MFWSILSWLVGGFGIFMTIPGPYSNGGKLPANITGCLSAWNYLKQRLPQTRVD